MSIVEATGIGIGLSLLGVLYPARVAARMQPVEAMRVEQAHPQPVSMEVDMAATLPKLKKEGRLHAFRFITRLGKIFYDADRMEEAIARFRTVIERHPRAGATPEAIFLLGVAEYKRGHDPKALRQVWETLSAAYPQSEWTRRAEPYSAIPL